MMISILAWNYGDRSAGGIIAAYELRAQAEKMKQLLDEQGSMRQYSIHNCELIKAPPLALGVKQEKYNEDD